jgi:two-component system sensor histidine kinase LytS
MVQHLWLELSALLMFIYFLNQSKVFRQSVMHDDNPSLLGKFLLSVAFGLIGIFGTYWGIPVVNGMPDTNAFGIAFQPNFESTDIDGIANTRAVGVIVGGLVGGPFVGTVAGLIAGVHRILAVATFSSFMSGGITIAQGIAAGMIHKQIKNRKEQWRYGLLVGLGLEAVHMLLLYLLGEPTARTSRLVFAITPAMLITNSIGVAAFIGILEAGYREKERTEALAAKIALNIANKTMTFLRAGLNEQSALEAANIIYRAADQLGAVAITSRERILAFVGASRSITHSHSITTTIAQVVETGEYSIYQKKADIGCADSSCPLASQIIVPLKDDGQVVGTLVLYRLSENSISLFETELACGLAKLISTQIEISKGERQAKLRANAEVQALQAQINPHFLFNALNTISYYCRKQPATAKRLIVHLGNYYRSNLAGNDVFVTLRKEIQCVDDYVKIEMARFEGKLIVE